MKMRIASILLGVSAAVLGLGATASGEEWLAVGGASKGMGSTGVALDRSPYWNPAAIQKHPSGKDGTKISNFLGEIDLAVLFGLEITAQGDVAAEADDVIDLVDEKDFEQVQARLDDGTASITDIEYALVLIKEINDLNRRGEGIYASSGTNVYLRLGKNIGLSLGSYAWSGADPNFDLSIFSALSSTGFGTLFTTVGTGDVPGSPDGWTLANELETAGMAQDEARELAYIAELATLDLSNPDVRSGIVLSAVNTDASPGTEGTLYNNKSGFTLSGVIVQELGLNISLPLISDQLSVGATFKLLIGTTFKRDYYIKDIDKGKDLLDETYQDFQENRETSIKFGLDLGLIARPIPQLAMGLTAKNLTSPSFRMAGEGSYAVKPQVRAGVAFIPHPKLSLAMDFDLFRNDSQALGGFYSQILGAGLQFKPADSRLFGFALRAGVYQNLAMSTEEAVYTAGIAIRIWAFELELAGNSSLYFKTMADVEKETQGDPGDPNPDREVDVELPERMGLGFTFRFLLKF